MTSVILLVPFSILIFLLIFGLLYFIIKKSTKPPINIMLLGVEITLVGGIIAVDPNSNLGLFEYVIILIGLIVTIAGFATKKS